MPKPTTAWLDALRAEFVKRSGMTAEDADLYVCDVDWDDYYDDGYSPQDAAAEEMSYWED